MESKLPFGKKNYQLMIIGVVVLVLGFIIMSIDQKAFGFGVMGLVIGPVVVMAGFIIEIWAILHNPVEKK